MDAQTYHDLNSSMWNEINPSACPCRGTGWMLSDFDTWHQCRTHGKDVPHPDFEDGDRSDFDYAAHKLAVLRTAYVTFRKIARNNGFRGNFKHACWARIQGDATPEAWVNAADDLADEFARDEAEHQALRMGYSCALEQRLHEEAMVEHAERQQYLGWIN